jgi:hypothetical protein
MKKFEGLSPLYKALKKGLSELDGVDAVEWFHGYENIVIKEQGIFIEFPEGIDFVPISKSLRRAPVKLRLHTYTKVVQDVDGYIAQPIAEAHDAYAVAIKNYLDNKVLVEADGDFFVGDFDDPDFFTQLPNPETLTKHLHFSGWKHFHSYQGMMITWVDFTTFMDA